MASGLIPGTNNAKFNPSSDHKTPNLGSLNLSAMTSPTALAGTNGVCVSLVHGDVWNQMEGNQTENILKNRTTIVNFDEKCAVNQNMNYYVAGKTNDTRIGVHNQTNMSPRNDIFMHTRSEIHHEKENRQQLTQDMSVVTMVIEFCATQWEKHDYKISAYLAAVNLNVMSADARIYAFRNTTFKTENTSIGVKISEITGSLGGLATEIKGLKLKAAVSHIKAIAGNINAGIALNADSPFG